jgi:tRNA (cytidine/uridine-2'-O-)-methyltransferase
MLPTPPVVAPAPCGLRVVLVEPEIPPNTGNIARLCLAAGAALDLIEPLGFSLEDKFLKRAGMDYLRECEIHVWPSWLAWRDAHAETRCWYFTTKAARHHWGAPYQPGDALIFGRESKGLPESLLMQNADQLLRIPMLPNARSLNLATSAGIALYEAWRVASKF